MSKIMLKVILIRFQPIAEEYISKEQARFRAGRSKNEHILMLRIIPEKYTEHHNNSTMYSLNLKKCSIEYYMQPMGCDEKIQYKR